VQGLGNRLEFVAPTGTLGSLTDKRRVVNYRLRIGTLDDVIQPYLNMLSCGRKSPHARKT
jgi:hypothetical protein